MMVVTAKWRVTGGGPSRNSEWLQRHVVDRCVIEYEGREVMVANLAGGEYDRIIDCVGGRDADIHNMDVLKRGAWSARL